jgi:hypothetical protein
MKRTHLIGLVVGLAGSVMLAQDAFGRARMYNPTLGRFMQRDPLGTSLQPPLLTSPQPILERNVSDLRFTQRDQPGEQHADGSREYGPMAQYEDGGNLYGYVDSRPLYMTDPRGLGKCLWSNGKCRNIDCDEAGCICQGDNIRCACVVKLPKPPPPPPPSNPNPCPPKKDCYCMCNRKDGGTNDPVGRMSRSECKKLPGKKTEYSFCYCKGDP